LAGLAVAVPLVVLGLWPDTPHPDVTARPIRVLTFNIEQGLTLGQLHLDQLAGYVEQADPDVVVLQEVGRGWALSGMTDGGEWFSRRLGMPFVWGPAADNQFGNVVMSRLPITDQQLLDLGKGHGTQDRSAILVSLDLGRGRDLGVIGTHLMNGSRAPMHESRAQAYRDILDAWAGRPRTVFLGDLNTYPRDVPPGWPELNLPLDAGFRTNQDVDECTMPTSNQNCPDWIFVTSDLTQSPVTIVVDRPDHRPITAEVTPSP
jgi:endonuclease/exonuclease/phosphatase family metal-dependent hydrolase